MKASDLIAEFLAMHVKHVFAVSGGANLHILDSIGERSDVKLVCPQIEQTAALAADAYARINGIGVAIATSGPGATNLITGIAASYYDSIPVLYITGNQTVDRLKNHGSRQYGFQAMPTVEIVRSICKFSHQVRDAKSLMEVLGYSINVATTGRKGPVVIDIPDDISRCNL